jgi:hypothetical protein
MAIKKSKVKSKPTLKSRKTKAKAKPVTKIKKKVLKSKPIRKPILKAKSKTKAIVKTNKTVSAKALGKLPLQTMEVTRQMLTPQPTKRPTTTVVRRVARSQPSVRSATQFTFMKAPITEHAFEVGDTVEVFCDHEKSRERIRGWIKGIVVQVDNKMVAVQFRSNVFLTDGWMVPDRILWYPLNSEHIRAVPGKKPLVKKEFIPDY